MELLYFFDRTNHSRMKT